MKKPVIKVEVVRINDNYSYVILKKLSNSVFIEESYKKLLCSKNSDKKYILNKQIEFDLPFIAKNSDVEPLLKAYEEINKEFGIEERWRANKNEKYFLVSALGAICDSTELNSDTDNKRYEAGNYFKTEKEAEILSNLYKESLKVVKNKNK